MTHTFADPATRDVFINGTRPRAGWQNIAKVAARKLDMLHAAIALDDLRSPPKNVLEALIGDRCGQHSIRINDQYRVCFTWTDAGPARVEIIDYHK